MTASKHNFQLFPLGHTPSLRQFPICLAVMASQKTHKLLLTLVVEHKITVSKAWCGGDGSTSYVCRIQLDYTIHNPHNGPSFNIGGRHLEGHNPQ
jgi:hypothetical protein